MSLALRDTCLGVVELAHPDTKPALRDDYRAAFISVGIISDALSADELARQRRDWAYLFQVGGWAWWAWLSGRGFVGVPQRRYHKRRPDSRRAGAAAARLGVPIPGGRGEVGGDWWAGIGGWG